MDPQHLKTAAIVGGVVVGGVVVYSTVVTGRYLLFTKVGLNSTGTAARVAQKRINRHGYGAVDEDGNFGDKSVTALKNFQSARGLAATGETDVGTWWALSSAPPRATGSKTLAAVMKAMQNLGYVIYDDGTWNIVSIRNRIKDTNTFNDEMHVFRKSTLGWDHYVYPMTTDPGTSYLVNPMNETSGTGAIVEGQYVGAYVVGTHNGSKSSYTALVQRGGPIRAYRDRDRDKTFEYDPNSIQEGYFGMNIHRAAPDGEETVVNTFSAGCQVFARTDDFNEFLEMMQDSGQESFTYTLLHEDQVPTGAFAEVGSNTVAWIAVGAVGLACAGTIAYVYLRDDGTEALVPA